MTDQFVTAASFAPDWVSPPGDMILDLMEEREWTQAELAASCRQTGWLDQLPIKDLMKEGVIEKHRVDPLAQLSLYGKSNDRFWFTLFHETAHILLHGKEKKSMLH